MKKRQEIEHLFHLYLTGQCSQEDLQVLSEYFHTEENESLLKALIKNELEALDTEPGLDPSVKDDLDAIYQVIKKKMQDPKKPD